MKNKRREKAIIIGTTVFALAACCGSIPLHADTTNAPILSFQNTYSLIQSSSFDLRAAEAHHESTYGDVAQASAIPNPNLILGLSNIGDEDEDDKNELTIAISQLVELGGKRSARIRKAQAEQCASAWQFEKQKSEIRTNLLHRFIDISAQQELLNASQAIYDIACKNMACAQEKEAAGKQSLLDTKKADIATKTAKIDLMRREIEYKKSKRELHAMWKSCPEGFQGVEFPLLEVAPLPPLADLQGRLYYNPDLLYGEAQLLIAWEAIEVEKAAQMPDLALQVGVSTDRFTQDPTLNVGVSFPLMIFNCNRGNVAKTTNQYNEACFLQDKLLHTLESTLNLYYEQWSAAYEEVIAVKETILPQAEETFEMAMNAYKEGKFTYLELLEAESTLFSVKEQLIEAAKEYHHKRADVLQLIGFNSLKD